MLTRFKFFLLCFVIITATHAAMYYGGSILTQRRDQAEALTNGAGYYDSHNGSFRFAVAPIEMPMPSLDKLSEALPMPKHKPMPIRNNGQR